MGVLNDESQVYIVHYTNDRKKMIEPLHGTQIWLKAMVDSGTGRLSWSLDDKKYQQLPDTISFKRQWFENHKISLFSYNIKEPAGAVSFECFKYKFTPGIPGNL